MELSIMNLVLVTTVVIAAAVTTVLGGIPRGYILKVSAICGKGLGSRSVLMVRSDLVVSAYAACVNGNISLVSLDGVNFLARATYRTRNAGNACVLFRRSNSNVYTVDVHVAFGEKGKEIEFEGQVYTLTCVYDSYSKQNTKAFSIGTGLVPPSEMRYDIGKKTTSTITLNVYSVDGEKLTGSIPRGIKVFLGATTNGENNEAGLRPVTCDAIGTTSGARLPILRSGCATNKFFGQFKEFTTLGRNARSPFFEMVQIEGNPSIRFECVFTLCATKCNGGSCQRQRKRRTTDTSVETTATEELNLE